MIEFLTPKQLAEQGVMSLVKQWQERKAGRLRCYRAGRKILYTEAHLIAYLEKSAPAEGEALPSVRPPTD
jgi:hypothetical protein